MGAARPSAGVAALNGSFVEFDGSGALGQKQSLEVLSQATASGWLRPFTCPPSAGSFQPCAVIGLALANMRLSAIPGSHQHGADFIVVRIVLYGASPHASPPSPLATLGCVRCS